MSHTQESVKTVALTDDATSSQIAEASDFIGNAFGAISRLMGDVSEPTVLAETLTHTFHNPAVFGQLVMSNLGNSDSMSEEDKQYWLQVAHHMGPDWIAKFRKVGAWMEKAESFR